jgi:3-methyladenine DNA glycosylase AlkD
LSADEGTPAADAFVALVAAFDEAADPKRAGAMAAYMRGQFPFLGLAAPEQRRVAAEAWRHRPRPDEAAVVTFTERCWARPEREYQYAGCDYAIRFVGRCSAPFVTHAEHLITTKSWWDTVDALATRVVGPLVRAHPSLVSVMDEWADADDIWLVRTAIVHQLHFKAATDSDRLFGYCAAHARDREFFVRKAIGWALREHSKTDADAVRRFVSTHAELSGLSGREALKWLDRRGRVSASGSAGHTPVGHRTQEERT